MVMPLIPALAGDDVEALPLAELLANLSDDDVAYLETAAAEWAAGTAGVEGEEVPEGEEEAADEATETSEEQEAEAEAGTEEHTARDMLEACRTSKYQVDDGVREVETIVNDAAAHKKAGVDLEGLKEQLTIATDAQAVAETCMEDAQDSLDGDDLETASKAAAECEKQSGIVQKALKAVRSIVGKSAKEAMSTAVPEEVLQFDAWAKRITGTGA